MFIKFSEIENLDKEILEKISEIIDIKRIFVDRTDYTCFADLYEMLKITVEDPRRTDFGNVRYDFWEVITIIIICTLFGISTIKYIVDFANKNIDQFRHFLKLSNGVPKYDTFLRALHAVSPSKLAELRKKWLEIYPKAERKKTTEKFYYEGKEISICAQDGKTITGSGCKQKCIRPAHVVSNFNTQAGEVNGEYIVEYKKNEIEANEELVRFFHSMEGTLTTFDAMGCQKNLAIEINNKGGLWLFQVKMNQPKLYDDILFAFENKFTDNISTFEKNRDRYEKRIYYYSNDINYIPRLKDWEGIKAFGLIYNITIRDNSVSKKPHLYIMNFDNKDLFMKSSREHWAIENKLHYIADTVFLEDKCKVIKGNAPEALNVIRKIGVSLFQRISLSIDKSYSIKRLVNMARNSISDLAELILGNFSILT